MSRYGFTAGVFILIAAACSPSAVRAQTPTAPSPSVVLSEALTAACRQSQDVFATYLTAENASFFRTLPPQQRVALLERFVLLDAPGRPLLSNDSKGRPVEVQDSVAAADRHTFRYEVDMS